MDLDHTFRMLMVTGFLLLFPIGLYYRAKSQASGERLDRSREGMFILVTLRPLGLIYWAGTIAYMTNPAWMAWSSVALPAWLRWTGAALAPLGAGLLVWTFRTLGPNLTDTVVTRRSHTLVTRGPYRFVRHPFYDSAALLIAATSMMMANWFVLVTGALVFLLLAVRSRIEEEQLFARFGEPYRAYRTQTGRFLPRRIGGATQR
jgi:protein-S-isoprenylcysteine O-methyltransferase Ste14